SHDRVAATLINTIGGRAPLDQGQVNSELGAAARGIGLVVAAGSRPRRREGTSTQAYQDASIPKLRVARRHYRVELAQQHLDRKSLVSLIEGPAVRGALISIGNAAIKVSDSRPIHE